MCSILLFFGKFHFHVRSHYGVVVYLPRGIFKAIKFPNVNQFRSIFTFFFVLQTRFIIYISNSRSLAPATAAVTQKKLQQAFLLPILAGYCGVGEPWKIGDYLVSISGRPMLIVFLMFLFLDNFYHFLFFEIINFKKLFKNKCVRIAVCKIAKYQDIFPLKINTQKSTIYIHHSSVVH